MTINSFDFIVGHETSVIHSVHYACSDVFDGLAMAASGDV